MQGSQEGKRTNLWGPLRQIRSKHTNENRTQQQQGYSVYYHFVQVLPIKTTINS